MTEQQVVNLFNRLYTWNTLATNLNASSVLTDIPNRYGLLKIVSIIEGLKIIRILDRHFSIEGGTIISDVGYLNDYEYHINYEINSSIKPIVCKKLSHTVVEEEQKLKIDNVDVSNNLTWSVYYTDPFYL